MDTPKTSLELELESLAIHRDAYKASISNLQANHNADKATILLEQRSLKQVEGRIDELGKIKASAGQKSGGIPSVQ